MKLIYTLNENDYLEFQLFSSSISNNQISKRRKNVIRPAILYMIIAVLFYFTGETFQTIGFLILGVLWFFFFPLWQRRHYKNHFRDHIRESYKENFGKENIIEIDDEYIKGVSKGREGKVSLTELNEIIEIPNYIYLKLTNNQTYILPKNQIKELDSIRDELKTLTAKLKINYSKLEKWEWK